MFLTNHSEHCGFVFPSELDTVRRVQNSQLFVCLPISCYHFEIRFVSICTSCHVMPSVSCHVLSRHVCFVTPRHVMSQLGKCFDSNLCFVFWQVFLGLHLPLKSARFASVLCEVTFIFVFIYLTSI